MIFQQSREILAGELATLVGIDDVRGALTGQSLMDHLNAVIGGQYVGQPPRSGCIGWLLMAEQIRVHPSTDVTGYIGFVG